MAQDQNIHIKNSDHLNITALLDSAIPEARDLLQIELDRAVIVADDELQLLPLQFVVCNGSSCD